MLGAPALVVLLLQAPQEEYVPKSAKGPYLEALGKYERATKAARVDDRETRLVDTDPEEALRILDDILRMSGVEKRECRLKIEVAGGEYRRYDFYPLHFRGRALLNLAAKSDPERAMELLESAVKALEESAKKLDESRPYLARAKAELERLRSRPPPADDPESDFRPGWLTLIGDDQYARARDYVESRGGVLSAEKRRRYLAETERACREFLAKSTGTFQLELTRLDTPRKIRTMRREFFEKNYTLPDRGLLLAATPEYEWCVTVRGTLLLLLEGREALDRLLDHAVAAVPLVEGGENRWFAIVENLAFEIAWEAVEKRARDARDAPAERREALRSEADALVHKWQAFDARVRQAAKDRPDFLALVPRRDFAPCLQRFPVEDESVGRIAAMLRDSAQADNPAQALGQIDADLEKIEAGLDRLPLEARRAVLTYRIVVAALRGFLAARTADEIARDLRRTASQLRGLGGSFDQKAYGPKVQQVFDRLR